MKDMQFNTEYLINKLRESDNIKDFLKNNETVVSHDNFAVSLSKLIDLKGKSNAEVFESAQISESTGYQILSGRRLPSRDKVLKLSIAIQLDLFETNKLLRISKRGELYVKDKKDAIVIFSINNSLNITKTNELLFDEDCNILK